MMRMKKLDFSETHLLADTEHFKWKTVLYIAFKFNDPVNHQGRYTAHLCDNGLGYMKDHLPYQLTTWLETSTAFVVSYILPFYCNFKIYNFISPFTSPRSLMKGNRHLIATPENRGLARPGTCWQPSRYQGQDKEHKEGHSPSYSHCSGKPFFLGGDDANIYRPVFTGYHGNWGLHHSPLCN
jgi:hypothetical protein